jgi:hypothetical protein
MRLTNATVICLVGGFLLISAGLIGIGYAMSQGIIHFGTIAQPQQDGLTAGEVAEDMRPFAIASIAATGALVVGALMVLAGIVNWIRQFFRPSARKADPPRV